MENDFAGKNALIWRRRAFKILCIVIVLVVPAAAGFPRDQGGPAGSAPADSGQNTFKAGVFANPIRCRLCHRDIYDAWAGSKHRFAWEDPFYQPDYLKASLETKGFTDVFCGECHAPIAKRTNLLPPKDGSLFDETSGKGISCDYCHTVTEVIEPVNIKTLSDPGRTKRGPRGDGRSPAHDIVYSAIHTDAAFCGACHNVVHPTTGTILIDTYNDWKNGPYAAAGIRCQDCHMTPGPGVGKNPGKSSPKGKKRDHVATHFFPGGSVFFQNRAGNVEQEKMALEMLKAAAEIKTSAARKEGGIALAVRIHNIGAGHKIPTGVAYMRKMWLEITASDQNGKTLYQSGHVTQDNRVDPKAVFYRTLFKDAEGNLTPKSWLAHEIGYDRRIPAKGQDEQTFFIPAEAKTGPCNILVRLLYRSMSQEAADGFGMDNPVVPSIEMARAEINVP